MKVLLIGSGGQLGWELQRTCPAHIRLIPYDYPEIDFCSTTSIQNCIQKTSPDSIINAAAYTAVDTAEKEEALAYRINHQAVMEIAQLSEKYDIALTHISTDFVFNGQTSRPYKPGDTPYPESVYGDSKLKGENEVSKILKDKALIIRTAWLYSSHGHNFVKTMLKLMKEKKNISVIDDQVGTPTWANGLAHAIWDSIGKKISGLYHWTDAGVASWYDFAVAIQEESMNLGLLSKSIPIYPIPESNYPTPAKRPRYGVLDKIDIWGALGKHPVHWRVQLRKMLREMDCGGC